MKNEIDVMTYSSESEVKERNKILELFKNSPIPHDQILSNMGLYLNSKDLSRILFMDYIYKKIIDVQGVVFDFGTRWGNNAALFSSLRGIYEPFNRHRKVVAFDSFCGFPEVTKQDGYSDLIKTGNVSVTNEYEKYLTKVLDCKEQDNPLAHIQKFEVIKGDAVIEIEKYLKKHPHTIVSLAYFDFDIYKPTKHCLEMIADRVTKGTVLAFDELNDPDSPGETIALMETLGLRNVRLKRHRYTSRVSYFVVE